MSLNSIFILLFPPGCGGNHLANLLSLNEQFQTRASFDDLLEKYKSDSYNHHAGLLENLRNFDYPNSFEILKETKGIPIICSHIIEYYHFIQYNMPYNIFNYWDNQNVIMFSFPKEESIGYKRFYPFRYGESIDNDNSADIPIETYKTFYDTNTVKTGLTVKRFNTLQLNVQKAVMFDTDKFMNEAGFTYAQRFFYDEYNIEIPDIGERLHQIWYSKILAHIY